VSNDRYSALLEPQNVPHREQPSPLTTAILEWPHKQPFERGCDPVTQLSTRTGGIMCHVSAIVMYLLRGTLPLCCFKMGVAFRLCCGSCVQYNILCLFCMSVRAVLMCCDGHWTFVTQIWNNATCWILWRVLTEVVLYSVGRQQEFWYMLYADSSNVGTCCMLTLMVLVDAVCWH